MTNKLCNNNNKDNKNNWIFFKLRVLSPRTRIKEKLFNQCFLIQHFACRNAVGIFDVTSFGKILVIGSDATSELQRLCANNIDVPNGTIVYTQMLNYQGGIEADITVHRLSEEEYIIITATSSTPRDMRWVTITVFFYLFK